MAGNRHSSEVPYQNYDKLKQTILMKRQRGKHELFVDPSFPPDLSSLTYVYIGDDRYERTKFARPLDIYPNGTFAGVCGVWNVQFPWRHFKKRAWFEAAVQVLSLAVRYMEKVIPGYRNCEQNFDEEYIGAFHFNFWRFGKWVETTVDDNLPVLDGKLMYCNAQGEPPEFWGALLEKAYAKFNKAYETIEYGDVLDALTDLTGVICEYFTPDVNPPEQFFYTLYSSVVNRSLVVCWRNEKRLTRTGFNFEGKEDIASDLDNKRYLHLVTAVTKFPLIDGREVEVVRLRCFFPGEPKWNGKFSDRDATSWLGVNKEFNEKYTPLKTKEDNEYWMTLNDFQCNFGGLIICSGTDPYRAEGFGVMRSYTCKTENLSDLVYILHSQRRLSERRSSSLKAKDHGRLRNHVNEKVKKTEKKINEIKVTETNLTVKMDTCRRHSTGDATVTSENITHISYPGYITDHTTQGHNIKCQMFTSRKHHSYPHEEIYNNINTRVSFDLNSSNSTSDISVIISRPHSAPMSAGETDSKYGSSGSVSQLTQSNFLATRKDFFRPRGGWKQIIEQHGKWTKNTSGITSSNLDVLSKCSRISIALSKKEGDPKDQHPSLSKKNLVLVSLLQDYRHGVEHSNNMPVQFGLSLFRCKNAEHGEKKHLSKLQFILNAESKYEARELRTRISLDDGCYVVVPYCLTSGHDGDYLLRIIGEKDLLENKNGW
ncbi:uncharacterized protein LOC133173991 [Saccostrea echinata]|uniref:uncharacterized protein LOC133173991 n=1 Tax=Saccostrea echinata TaxID=191078 RepID=UPI002A837A99|nr:uncharacterized protein LOC133173991 [Saccostrea echinata]